MQLLVKDEIVGQTCISCGTVKRLAAFPRMARRPGRGTWCSECTRKQQSAMNFAFSHIAVARRAIQGGTEPLAGDDS